MELANRMEKAKQLRADIVKMLYLAKSGHPGGALSCLEILIALYYEVMNVDPSQPQWEERDRFVLSKGHACPAQYAILADRGYFPREELWTLRRLGSSLQGHPDMRKTPGVDVNSGSLGQGISIAVGMAIAAKLKGEAHRVYTVIGDGESQEGLVWEAAMSAAHNHLDNLTVILDHNGMQIDGTNDEVMSLGDVMKKFDAFGFECVKVADGHDVEAIVDALKTPHDGKPLFVCCETHKGHGVSFMEDQVGWHGKAPNREQYEQAMKELGVAIDG